MSDTVKTIAAIALIFVALPLLILWLRDRRVAGRRRHENSPELLQAKRAAYEERILRPDWMSVERHLQRSTPSTLRELR
jgi:hypothetical protein